MSTPLNEAEFVAAPAAPLPVDEWRRVEVRTVLVRPFNELLGFIPALIGIIALGRHADQRMWFALGAIGLLLLRGLLHWLTTRYRITEEQVEVRSGLVFRKRAATRRSRVRTVESTAKLGHRLFGVTAVRIGTGQHDQKRGHGILLDAVTPAEADRLRKALLRRTAAASQAEVDAPVVRSTPIASLNPSWLRYAPLTLSGLVAVGALLGLIWRSLNELGINPEGFGPLRDTLRWATHSSPGLVIGVTVLIALVIIVFGSMVVYVFQFNGYRLTRESDDTLHVRRGLLTTSMVTIEEARLRGVEVREPLLLRAGRGARVSAVATGLRTKNETHLLMPPGPAAEAHRVAREALRAEVSPTQAALVPHPPVALRRRLVRAVVPAAVLVVALWGAATQGWLPGWPWQAACVLVVLGVPLALSRYRGLGHAVLGDYLVTRSGSLNRSTVAVRRAGIIGWQVRRSVFQRRQGLVTLTATIAAGRGAYRVLDVEESEGLAVAEEAVPGLLTPFLVRD
jgi:putative membrane protein